jgi:hypothetical protein
MSPHQQRFGFAAAIVAAHTLAVLYLMHTKLLQFATAHREEPLIYLREFKPSTAWSQQQSRAPRPRPPARSQIAAPPSRIAAPELPANPPPLQWGLAAQSAADDLVAAMARREKRKCDDSDKPGSWLPKCKKPAPSFQWNEQPRQAGFMHGLPYVRLGDHCILVAGMVGCAIGPLPKANEHLFDDLKDPDRDRSSVPEVADVNEPVSTAPPIP